MPRNLKARAISVGVPLDAPDDITEQYDGHTYGYAVPEADREVKKTPLKNLYNKAVDAEPCKYKDEQFNPFFF